MAFRNKERRQQSCSDSPGSNEAARDRAIDEGLLIARFAVVMEVKNRIIVRALQQNVPFDTSAVHEAVRSALSRLAREQRQYAERVLQVRAKAARARGRVRHEHDYRSEDLEALLLRHDVYSGLADRLECLRDDDEYVGSVAEAARVDAWDDLSGALGSRLDRLPKETVRDAEYYSDRTDRIRRLVDEDLMLLKRRMDEI